MSYEYTGTEILEYVWTYAEPDFYDADVVPATPTARVERDQVAAIEWSWWDGADEPTFAVLGSLTDGRWFTVEAWHDYTGWDCRSGADVRISRTRDGAIAAMTETVRREFES